MFAAGHTPRIVALWLGLAVPSLPFIGGCATAPAAHQDETTYDRSSLVRTQPRVCVPSDELAVTVAYGVVAGVHGTEAGKCTVFYNGATDIDYQVAVDKPEQCTPAGLAAFGHKLPRKPPVCS